MLKQLASNMAIAMEAVFANKIRSLLTALGIIFGVAAVIAMLAIGAGAQQEILEQIKLVGVNNIVITPVIEQTEGEVQAENAGGEARKQKNLSIGLNFLDVESIKSIVPGIEVVSPEVVVETSVSRNAFHRSAKLVGVENSYFEIAGFRLLEGNFFNEEHAEMGKPVCIVGKSIAAKFFNGEEPLGKYLKVGKHWLRVIGVLEERLISDKSISNLGIRDYNMDVYTPLSTALLRYENRAMVSNAAIQEAIRNSNMGVDQGKAKNYHQLDRLVIKVADSDKMNATAEVISKLLKRKHSQVVDYEITIPELLLKQQQRTKNIFNYVLGGIAGISLLVGGIGIMNIMLASVLERIKEIGLRLAIGATKRDIIYQFLLESVMISFSGGMIGIILGLSIAFGISQLADIPTLVHISSIALSFGVAVTVGIIFGITPAKRAASQDPITSLRYE
ncbi:MULTISPECIES: ABC transporter permease [Roseivirga]|jgi:putative ABC transport system permease protein|uniref:Multidrug ABC transporter substrate-binding protein n=1 Tax=Roseivirga thermotolerans TaxID=1758176 RepID=A0ABQ3IC50_9BACT|nr:MULTISPECIES: ABC transporter permease [Roseivirga]MEC7755927.1 ABC transporter permease [Bacteroidota bacterium]GHE69581.1 multidrug ABC transporter substrate-binding protein [Roseivirga thermotolerans]|tara:strand:+ start:4203 stop:5543 length:1341 start_codon:yes stop_codon:yes gene_type:complete